MTVLQGDFVNGQVSSVMNEEQPKTRQSSTTPAPLREHEDYYIENGLWIFTAAFHLKRGYCCGNGCLHCPYKAGKA